MRGEALCRLYIYIYIFLLVFFLYKLWLELMCELQDSCQTEPCLLNTYNKALRVGLVQ